jgi:hypothetical protein
MSANSTNVHHSAPSSFRVFCSRLGSCQQNCNFCCQMLKPCWLLPHVLNTLSSQLVLAMMLFPPLDTKPFSSFAHQEFCSQFLSTHWWGFICTFSLLISLSITLQTRKFRNQFKISSKYFDMACYLKRETFSDPISFEVQWNVI